MAIRRLTQSGVPLSTPSEATMSCGCRPPGFGAPLPDGFPATQLAYRDWLEDELEGHRATGRPPRTRLGRRPRCEPGHAPARTRAQLGQRRPRIVRPALCRDDVARGWQTDGG